MKVLTKTLSIFCNVIDNFGDAGFCLRLARDLSHLYKVELLCDNLETLNKIKEKLEINDNLKILKWPQNNNDYHLTDIIIEAFSCRLPKFCYEKIKEKGALVIELEYLTAERFAEECHGLKSFTNGIESYFFFPGFTNKTGGVIIEKELIDFNYQSNNLNKNKFFINIFSYKTAPLKKFFKILFRCKKNFEINVFEGLAQDCLNESLSLNLGVEENIKINNCNIKILKMVPQSKFDELLFKADLNLVRGEDSIVRAMLSGKPFLWNIYPQSEDAHKEKLKALFARMRDHIQDSNNINRIEDINLSYNHYGDALENLDLFEFYPAWLQISKIWSEHLKSLGSLTDNLHKFIEDKLSENS